MVLYTMILIQMIEKMAQNCSQNYRTVAGAGTYRALLRLARNSIAWSGVIVPSRSKSTRRNNLSTICNNKNLLVTIKLSFSRQKSIPEMLCKKSIQTLDSRSESILYYKYISTRCVPCAVNCRSLIDRRGSLGRYKQQIYILYFLIGFATSQLSGYTIFTRLCGLLYKNNLFL